VTSPRLVAQRWALDSSLQPGRRAIPLREDESFATWAYPHAWTTSGSPAQSHCCCRPSGTRSA